jgi:hypothetical protein
MEIEQIKTLNSKILLLKSRMGSENGGKIQRMEYCRNMLLQGMPVKKTVIRNSTRDEING